MWQDKLKTLIENNSRPKFSDFDSLFVSTLAENHTLHSGTYLYSSYMGVPLPPSPGASNKVWLTTVPVKKENRYHPLFFSRIWGAFPLATILMGRRRLANCLLSSITSTRDSRRISPRYRLNVAIMSPFWKVRYETSNPESCFKYSQLKFCHLPSTESFNCLNQPLFNAIALTIVSEFCREGHPAQGIRLTCNLAIKTMVSDQSCALSGCC